MLYVIVGIIGLSICSALLAVFVAEFISNKMETDESLGWLIIITIVTLFVTILTVIINS